jgi:hypothetical protein
MSCLGGKSKLVNTTFADFDLRCNEITGQRDLKAPVNAVS